MLPFIVKSKYIPMIEIYAIEYNILFLKVPFITIFFFFSEKKQKLKLVTERMIIHINACRLMKQEQNLLLVEIGYDLRVIEYITESPRSYPFEQLNSLRVEVPVESFACGDRRIRSSFTEKAVAVSTNAWNCSCLDSWDLKLMENGQLMVILSLSMSIPIAIIARERSSHQCIAMC